VAVQGLGVDAFGTWSAKGGPDMWLRDFLPETVKNSRILIYGYNANLIGPGARSFASITDLAKGLVNALISARRHSSVGEHLCIENREPAQFKADNLAGNGATTNTNRP